MNQLTTKEGIIDALALDQRGSLVKQMKQVASNEGKPFSMNMIYDFKEAVSEVLSPLASAILLDEQMGFKAIKAKSPDTGLIMSYEKTGYDADTPGRLPSLLPDQSAQIAVQRGANALKVLVYYNPNDPDSINDLKKAFAQRYGTEGLGADVPTFFEVVTYDDKYASDSLEFAKEKPQLVLDSLKEFTKDKYHIDVLKMEVPFNPAFIEGWENNGQSAYSETEVGNYLKEMNNLVTRPFIFLSGGVPTDVFLRELKLAGKVGSNFSGVLSGRATWLESVDIFARDGRDALVDWLKNKGTKNIEEITDILNQTAKPWYTAYGSLDDIEVVDSGHVN